MNEITEKLINLAKENAKKGLGPFSAIVVDSSGKVISEAVNKVTNLNDPTAHAEILAIRSACKKLNTFNLKGYSIYTSCEPCPMCLSAIYWARIDKVYFLASKEDAHNAGFSDKFIYEEFCKKIEDRHLKAVKINNDKFNEPFKVWEENKNKIEY
jgi:guanine deaminase